MANLRTDKVRAFLSSLPPGEVKLTLVRQRDVVQAAMETQESDKYRSVCDVHVRGFILKGVGDEFYVHLSIMSAYELVAS